MPPIAVAEFQSTLGRISALASSDILTVVIAALQRLSGSEARSFVTDTYPRLLERYLRLSSEATVQWYAEQPSKRRFAPEPIPLVARKRLAVNARWAATQADPAAALTGSATRAVFDQSRFTVVTNAKREKVSWARHASPDACEYCRMLAVGVVDGGKPSARSHDRCNCLAVPIRDGVYVPPEYVTQWGRELAR
jgi:hypothetical protein